MLYLASQFAWFLLAAFGLGFVMGWAGHDGAKLEIWSHKLAYAAGAWVLAGAVSWLQALNGQWALLIESGLLFVTAYFAGCAAASAWRTALQPAALASALGTDASELTPPFSPPAPPAG